MLFFFFSFFRECTCDHVATGELIFQHTWESKLVECAEGGVGVNLFTVAATKQQVVSRLHGVGYCVGERATMQQ